MRKGLQRPGAQTPRGPRTQGPQASLGFPPLRAWPARSPTPCLVGTWRVCVNHPIHPAQAGHSECRVFKLPPSWPPGLLWVPPHPQVWTCFIRTPPQGGLAREALHRSSAVRACLPLMRPLWAAAGRAGPAPDMLPWSPGTGWLELPKPLRGLRRPRYLSVRIRSVLDVLLHPGMHVSLRCGPQACGPARLCCIPSSHGRWLGHSAPPTPRWLLSHTHCLQGPRPASQSLGVLTFESSLVPALRFSNLHVLALP